MQCCYAVWSRARSKVGQKLKKIDRVRRAHAQRHTTALNNAQKAQDKSSFGKVATCVFYNKGTCAHETKGVLYKHVCMSCWTKDGKSYPHPQTEYRKTTKNE